MRPFFKDPFAKIPIKIKLPFGLIMLFLSVIAVGRYFVINSVYSPMNREILLRLQSEAMSLAMIFDKKLESLARRAEDFSSDGFIRTSAESLVASDATGSDEDREKLLTHLKVNKLSIVDEFIDLRIYDLNRRLILAVENESPALNNALREAFEPGKQRFSAIIPPDSLYAFPSTAIATPLFDIERANQVGYLVCVVDLALVIERSSIGHNSAIPEPYREKYLSIEDQRGLILEIPWWYLKDSNESTRPGSERIGIRVFRGDQQFSRRLSDRTISQVGGDFFRETYSLDSVGWQTTIELDATEAMSPLSVLEGKYLGIASFVAIPILALLFFATQYVVQPLGELQRMARRIKEGDFSARNNISAEDEIGTLAKTSNLMAEAIEERTESLQHIAEDLQKRERELRVHHDLLDTVIHSMSDGLVLMNFQGKITLSNKAAKPLLGILSAADGHLNINKCEYHEDDSAHCVACMSDPSQTTSCVLTVEDKVYEVLSTRVQMPHGSSKVLVARNISEREQMHRQQGHQERLTVLGKLAAVVAHEMNNPLAAISMYNQMMESELPEQSQFNEHIDVIKRNTRTCQHIIRDLLDYARIPQPKIQETDLHDVLDDVVHFLRPLHGDTDIEISRNYNTEDSICWGDPTQLQQVFVNLLVNAFQAVDPQSGRVTIATEDVDSGQTVAVTVTDNGSGISPDHAEDIFDPFFTTKSSGGTGLGLSTSRRIIEGHEGTLDLMRSHPGRTEFRVILPHLRPVARYPLVQIEEPAETGVTS